jgi:hypothetical protein
MMMTKLRLTVTLAALLAVAALPAAAGTLTGTVRNATTGRPVAGENVVMMELAASMATIATARTDAQGRFRLEHDNIGRMPVLVRVTYRGVNYHANVPPTQTTADIEVYDATTDPSVFDVASRFLVVQPNGPELLVGEEFLLHNHSQPPVAYFKPDGTFEFFVPEGAQLNDVSAWGAAGMPTVQGTIARGGNRYAVAFPLRPGENGVRMSYQVPYPGNRATLRVSSPYASPRVVVVAPPTVSVEGAGLAPAGTEQGWSLYSRDALPAGATFEFTVSGTAPPPSDPAAGGGGGMAAQGNVELLPARLDNLKWILIGGFGLLFALGLMFLLRRPQPAPVAAAENTPAAPLAGQPAAPATAEAVAAAEAIRREVTHSLDELKDLLFKLELRRQAGTISEAEYAEQRGRAEKQLRDLVKG